MIDLTPKISIIVPVYNVEKFLDICIKSIINQSYRNLEIILVDDGSPDNCPKICDFYAEKDDRVIVIHKTNGGLSDARNSGLHIATGDYFLFVDSDDMIHEQFCEYLVKTAQKYKADIVSCDLLIFDNYNDIENLNCNCENITEEIFENKKALIEYLQASRFRKIYHGLCMKIYKKELFNNLEFEKGRLHEDVFITYKLLDKSNKTIITNAPYYFYYQNQSSICHNFKKKNFEDMYDALNNIRIYFSNRKDIVPYCNEFILYEYRTLVIKAQELNDEDVRKKIGDIKIWTLTKINNTHLSLIKKIKLLLGIFVPDIYKKINPNI